MTSQYTPPLLTRPAVPRIRPQAPTPPPAGRQNQAVNAPNTPVHLQHAHFGYDACWRRILDSLNQVPSSFEPFIFLLELEDTTFRYFQCLAVGQHYSLTVNHNDTALDLTLTNELWTDVTNCRARGHSNELSSFLQIQQVLLSSPVSPRRAQPVGVQQRGISPPVPDQLRRQSSQGSSSRKRSRSPSVGSSAATSESGESERLYVCPLAARGHCNHENYKKFGNARNHMVSQHGYYINEHPNWLDELRGVDCLRSPVEPEQHLNSSMEADFRQLGTSFRSHSFAPEQSFGGQFESQPSPQHIPQQLQYDFAPPYAPQGSPSAPPSVPVLAQTIAHGNPTDTVMGDYFYSGEHLMYNVNGMSQPQATPSQFDHTNAGDPFQQRTQRRGPSWTETRDQYSIFGTPNPSGNTDQQ